MNKLAVDRNMLYMYYHQLPMNNKGHINHTSTIQLHDVTSSYEIEEDIKIDAGNS